MLALPATSPITNETQLLQSIPNALYVEKHIKAEDKFWRWDGSTCNVYTGIKTGTFVRNDHEGSATCFTVNPGEGFIVGENQPAQYTIQGADASISISLLAAGPGSLTGENLISLPFCPNSSVKTASQLMNAIGFASVQNVQRYLCASDTFQVYTGRKASSPDFPLVPGEAYFVKVLTTANYVTSLGGGCGLPLCTSSLPATYNVSGTANTTTFAFKVLNGNGEVLCSNNCAPLSIGDTATQIASKFAAAINAACAGNGVPAATASASGTQFSVYLNQVAPPDLVVGTGNPPGCANDSCVASCDIGTSGFCQFNPTISLAPSNCTGFPNGTTCNDANACTLTDTCQSGTCVGSTPAADGTSCGGGNVCRAGVCMLDVPAVSTTGIAALMLFIAAGLAVWIIRQKTS